MRQEFEEMIIKKQLVNKDRTFKSIINLQSRFPKNKDVFSEIFNNTLNSLSNGNYFEAYNNFKPLLMMFKEIKNKIMDYSHEFKFFFQEIKKTAHNIEILNIQKIKEELREDYYNKNYKDKYILEEIKKQKTKIGNYFQDFLDHTFLILYLNINIDELDATNEINSAYKNAISKFIEEIHNCKFNYLNQKFLAYYDTKLEFEQKNLIVSKERRENFDNAKLEIKNLMIENYFDFSKTKFSKTMKFFILYLVTGSILYFFTDFTNDSSIFTFWRIFAIILLMLSKFILDFKIVLLENKIVAIRYLRLLSLFLIICFYLITLNIFLTFTFSFFMIISIEIFKNIDITSSKGKILQHLFLFQNMWYYLENGGKRQEIIHMFEDFIDIWNNCYVYELKYSHINNKRELSACFEDKITLDKFLDKKNCSFFVKDKKKRDRRLFATNYNLIEPMVNLGNEYVTKNRNIYYKEDIEKILPDIHTYISKISCNPKLEPNYLNQLFFKTTLLICEVFIPILLSCLNFLLG